jgi:hypothetical protein
MKTWLVGGVVVGAVVVAGVFFSPPKSIAPAPAVVVAEAPPVAVDPVAPVVLADVVNVTSIDALLDPPQIPVADSDVPTAGVVVSVSADHLPAVRPAVPPTIPAAAD